LNPLLRSELRLGELLAEGGEGRVFEVVSGPAGLGRPRVYKELRRPHPVPELSSLVGFPSLLAARDAPLSARVLSSSAWPVSVVVGDDPSMALGTVMPRAPNGFWVRHRDGRNRLASLSYLANDPDRIAVAYGVMMPAPGAPERVALVYALARLLDAWQAGGSQLQVVHGDLSAKNVLWSLDPVPAVYVLDCDGATVTAAAPGDPGWPGDADETGPVAHTGSSDSFNVGSVGLADCEPARPQLNGTDQSQAQVDQARLDQARLDQARLDQARVKRQRATTPNWGDPAVRPGGQPTEASDRYLLAIAFLRVVGAAHFPIQGHQRGGQQVNVDLELPRSWRKFPDMPGLWELCERSLSLVNAGDRPAPAEWLAHLEELLGVLSAGELGASVRQAQGDPRPALPKPASRELATPRLAIPTLAIPRLATSPSVPARTGAPSVTVPDVVVRPVLRHRPPSTWRLISASAPLGVGGEVMPGMGGAGSGGGGSAIAARATIGAGAIGGAAGTAPPLSPRQMVGQVMVMWGAAHRAAARWTRSPGRRAYGVRRLAGVLVLDLAAACVALFVVAMIVSPWIGL
jgi:hypothetical protein